jgi:NAD(P)-dependent dehydrogenase (short-subunit alcohol dehydrogenase family)
MEVRVDDKVLLVTGAVQGLGRALALEAARSGAAAIILTDRNTQRGDEVVSEVLKLGAKAALLAADLEEQDAPARIISAAIDQFGRLDGLVNAAGLSDRGSVAEADTELSKIGRRLISQLCAWTNLLPDPTGLAAPSLIIGAMLSSDVKRNVVFVCAHQSLWLGLAALCASAYIFAPFAPSSSVLWKTHARQISGCSAWVNSR